MMTTENLRQKGLTLSLESGRLAVSPKAKLTDDLRNFIRLHKEEIVSELRACKLESLFSANPDLREQFEFEVNERAAIMIFDGGLPEAEAISLSREDVSKIWFSLFGE